MQWKRILRVTVAGLVIQHVKIELDVHRETSPTSLTGHVAMYNLRPEHADRIYEHRAAITIEAGYQGNLSMLAIGRVQRVEKARDGVDRITKCLLDPITRSRPGLSSRSYEGAVSVRQVATDLVADFEEPLNLGTLDAIPAAAFVEDYVVDGPTDKGLSDLLAPHAVTWYCDDDYVRFNRAGYVQPGLVLHLDADTGLISSPTITDDGAEATSLIEPRARPGGVVEITSEALTGAYKSVKVSHIGDNYDGELLTHYDLRPQEAGITSPT